MIENNKSKIVKGQGKPNFSLWFFSVRNGARVRFLREVLGHWLAWAQDLCMLPQSLWVHSRLCPAESCLGGRDSLLPSIPFGS